VKNSQKNIPSDLRDAVADVTESKDSDVIIPAQVDVEAPLNMTCTSKGDLRGVKVNRNITIVHTDNTSDVYHISSKYTLGGGRTGTVILTGSKDDSYTYGDGIEKSVLFVYAAGTAYLAANDVVYKLYCR